MAADKGGFEEPLKIFTLIAKAKIHRNDGEKAGRNLAAVDRSARGFSTSYFSAFVSAAPLFFSPSAFASGACLAALRISSAGRIMGVTLLRISRALPPFKEIA